MATKTETKEPAPGNSNASGMGRIYICGGDRGGTGKSTTAQIVEAAVGMATQRFPKIIEVDAEKRLGNIYPEGRVISKIIDNAEVTAILEDPTRAFQMWEEIGTLMTQGGDVVLDLGGNLSLAFSEWVRQMGVAYLGDGENVEVLVLCSGDPVSIESCQQTLGRMRAALPKARRWLVINPLHAALSAESQIVQAIRESYGLSGVIVFKRCASPIFGAVLDMKKPFAYLSKLKAADFVGGSVTPGAAHVGVTMFTTWISEATRAVRPVVTASAAE